MFSWKKMILGKLIPLKTYSTNHLDLVSYSFQKKLFIFSMYFFIARILSYIVIKLVSRNIEFRGKIDNLIMKQTRREYSFTEIHISYSNYSIFIKGICTMFSTKKRNWLLLCNFSYVNEIDRMLLSWVSSLIIDRAFLSV